jgi:ATP-dependent RNA helicase RhlE
VLEFSLLLTNSNFDELGLAEPILRAVRALSYTVATPIQAASIPNLLTGRDLLGVAATGTGKTAAFGLPILQMLASQPARPGPFATRVLILAPTRELALQIHAALRGFAANMRVKCVTILGGMSRYAQEQQMRGGADIVVGTPGRICDLMNTKHLRLEQVGWFVLDEADRMLDLGFIRDIRKVVSALPAQRQSMLFSATMPAEVGKLASGLLRDPVRVEIAPPPQDKPKIVQQVQFVPAAQKQARLRTLLDDAALSRVIVFTRTKHGANKVCERLEAAGVGAVALHGNKSQAQRVKSLDRFSSGRARVLVATDIASRGIDVSGVSHVINFDLPVEPESYIHRIGRTGRAGASGIAISFCDGGERAALRAIERLQGEPLAVVGDPLPAGERGASDGPKQPGNQRRGGPRRRYSQAA